MTDSDCVRLGALLRACIYSRLQYDVGNVCFSCPLCGICANKVEKKIFGHFSDTDNYVIQQRPAKRRASAYKSWTQIYGENFLWHNKT